MASRDRARTRPPTLFGDSPGFWGELGRSLAAIPAFVLGLLLIAVFFQTAAEKAEGVWQAVVGFAVAIAVSIVGLLLVGWVAAIILAPAAVGWLGMCSGQCPTEFGPGQRNARRGAANLLVGVVGGFLGVRLFRHGVGESQLNWTVEGLFLVAGAVVMGLGAAVPRLYFARRHRRAHAEPVAVDGVVAFVTAATLGLGLSLGISMGFDEARPPAVDRALRAGAWHNGCVRTARLARCWPKATFIAVAAREGFHRVEVRGSCAQLAIEPADQRPVVVEDWFALRKRGIQSYDKAKDLYTHLVRLAAGQRIRLALTSRVGEACSFKIRYRATEDGPP